MTLPRNTLLTVPLTARGTSSPSLASAAPIKPNGYKRGDKPATVALRWDCGRFSGAQLHATSR